MVVFLFKGMYKLIILKDLSKHKEGLSGYDIIKKIEELKGKKPSSGYIYPLLKELYEQKYVSLKLIGRKKVYSISVKGKNFLKDLELKKKNLMNTFLKLDSSVKHNPSKYCYHNVLIKKILFYKSKIDFLNDKNKILKSDKILKKTILDLESLLNKKK